jgi:hypothetical protein
MSHETGAWSSVCNPSHWVNSVAAGTTHGGNTLKPDLRGRRSSTNPRGGGPQRVRQARMTSKARRGASAITLWPQFCEPLGMLRRCCNYVLLSFNRNLRIFLAAENKGRTCRARPVRALRIDQLCACCISRPCCSPGAAPVHTFRHRSGSGSRCKLVPNMPDDGPALFRRSSSSICLCDRYRRTRLRSK